MRFALADRHEAHEHKLNCATCNDSSAARRGTLGGGCAIAWLVLLALWLAGCGGTQGVAPISSSDAPARAKQTSRESVYHFVAPGETLNLIAQRYGVTYRQLAHWNRIDPPYRIFPGQRLSLPAPVGAVARGARAADNGGVRQREETVDDNTERDIVTPSSRVTTAEQKSSAGPSDSNTGFVTVTPGEEASSAQTQPVATPAPAESGAATPPLASLESLERRVDGSSILWKWPAAGVLQQRFSSANKGLNITGQEGQPIHATAAGRVVYSGTGLIGRGEVVIIKHDKTYLSAYAHNKKRLVKEGESVAAGQTIAEMGRTGTDQTMLYFEIRKDGKPVDPLQYLPKLPRKSP